MLLLPSALGQARRHQRCRCGQAPQAPDVEAVHVRSSPFPTFLSLEGV